MEFIIYFVYVCYTRIFMCECVHLRMFDVLCWPCCFIYFFLSAQRKLQCLIIRWQSLIMYKHKYTIIQMYFSIIIVRYNLNRTNVTCTVLKRVCSIELNQRWDEPMRDYPFLIECRNRLWLWPTSNCKYSRISCFAQY